MRMTPEARRPIYKTKGIGKRRLGAEAITPLTTWSAVRDEALKETPPAALSAQ